MPGSNAPLVSIIIPVYNGSNFMREAIDSALAQTYRNIEVIVVNDGSTDHGATESIARSYGDKIRYVKKSNGGVSSALNVGIKAMRGEYFSWLSHDDKYLPEKVESQINALQSIGEKHVIAVCGSKQIDKDSKDLISFNVKRSARQTYQIGEIIPWEAALKDVIDDGSYNGCALLIPKTAFDDCGMFDESLRYCQDFLMWIRIFLNKYSLVHTPGVHVCGRVHNGQLTVIGKDIFHKDSISLGNMLIKSLGEAASKEYNFLKSYAIYNAKYDNPTVVRDCIQEGKSRDLLTRSDCLAIKSCLLYGKIRPAIRKVYYRAVKRV
ncbi:glycosyltransferase [uncultured Dysosmobacter sp.]|uniref:glycosyltransferase family 2 protein n=1 Tax=uncultured Dysosmobacter sp. TaxID=2591384 RepID=UPI00262E89E2|nr:glycosyltransferase [uncultured Dysosmobacter sp.]